MTDAPKRIWIGGDESRYQTYWRSVPHPQPELAQEREYHLARPGQPCSDLEFMEKLWIAANRDNCLDNHEAMRKWLRGDFTAAIEGLE